jgi:O-antigen/teichoic acid export membrane protein
MILMALSLPFVARSRFSQGMLRAGGKPTQAYLPEGVIPPLFMIPLIAFLAYLSESSVTTVGGIFLLAAVGNWLFAIVLERRAVPATSDSAARKTSRDHPDWKRITAPIYLSALLAVANDKVVFLLLGAMEGEYAAGLYTAASRFMIIAGMIGTTLYLSHASRISVLYGKGDSAGLAAEVGHITRLVVALTLAICIPLMIWAEFFLGLFGSQFTAAVIPFRLLVLATFINVAMGPVGLLLNMSAFERTHTRILAVTLALSVGLGVAFIQIWGVAGAALAVVISTLFWNGALLYVVRRHFGIIPILARSSAPSADLAPPI